MMYVCMYVLYYCMYVHLYCIFEYFIPVSITVMIDYVSYLIVMTTAPCVICLNTTVCIRDTGKRTVFNKDPPTVLVLHLLYTYSLSL